MDIAPYVSWRIVFCILDGTFSQRMIKGPALTAPIKCLAIPFATPFCIATFFGDGRIEPTRPARGEPAPRSSRGAIFSLNPRENIDLLRLPSNSN